MAFELIIYIFFAGAVLGPIAGIALVFLARTPAQKRIARYILVAGTVPLGAVIGFVLFGIPSDAGWLGSRYRGEGAFLPALLCAFLGALLVPFLANRFVKRRFDSHARQGLQSGRTRAAE